VILKGKQLGFTLVEIRDMLAQGGRVPAAPPELRLSPEQIEDQIAHLENQKREIEEALAELKSQRRALARP
jgi:DNA-binding transcriptional MerR regulator